MLFFTSVTLLEYFVPLNYNLDKMIDRPALKWYYLICNTLKQRGLYQGWN